MELIGNVIAVLPVQTGEGRNGTWKKQEYVIEYDQMAQFPKKMMFNLWGDKIDQFNIQQGQNVKVSFDIDCREWNGRWFNDIRAWRVEPAESAQPQYAAPAPYDMPPPPPPASTAAPAPNSSFLNAPAGDEADDLPF